MPRRPKVWLTEEQDHALRDLYRRRLLTVDEYTKRPELLRELVASWRTSCGAEIDANDVLRYMLNQRKRGNWPKLGRSSSKTRPLPSTTLSDEERQHFLSLYRTRLTNQGLGSDQLLLDDRLAEEFQRQFARRSGRRLSLVELRGVALQMRKQMVLPRRGARSVIRFSSSGVFRSSPSKSEPRQLQLFDVPWQSTQRICLFRFNDGSLERQPLDDQQRIVEACHQSLLANGPDVHTVFRLGNALYLSYRYQAAAERFRQTIEMEPRFAGAWNNLGLCLEIMGQVEAAVDSFEHAIAVNPSHSESIENLKRIQS